VRNEEEIERYGNQVNRIEVVEGSCQMKMNGRYSQGMY